MCYNACACLHDGNTHPTMSDTEALTTPRVRPNLGAGVRNAWAPSRPARRQKAVFMFAWEASLWACVFVIEVGVAIEVAIAL